MRRAVVGMLLLSADLICGCGGGTAPESKVTAPPHGGNIVELPDGRGYVELKTEREPVSKGSRKTPVKSRIVAYFFQPDGSTSMSPPPSDVKLNLGGEGSGVVVALVPQSKEPDQLASELGDYPDELRGQIDYLIDGKPGQAKFTFR